jgi:hypothetical protein
LWKELEWQARPPYLRLLLLTESNHPLPAGRRGTGSSAATHRDEDEACGAAFISLIIYSMPTPPVDCKFCEIRDCV